MFAKQPDVLFHGAWPRDLAWGFLLLVAPVCIAAFFFVRDVDNCADFPTRARSPPLLLHRMSVFTTLRGRSVQRRSRGINGARRRPAPLYCRPLPCGSRRTQLHSWCAGLGWCSVVFILFLQRSVSGRSLAGASPMSQYVVAPPPWAASIRSTTAADGCLRGFMVCTL